MIFFALIPCWGWATASHSSAYWPCLDFQHHDCTACWEIARNFRSVRSFSHIFHFYTKSTATLTYHRNFLLVVFFSGRKFQNIVESQGYFVLEWPFLQFHEQRAKFRKQSKSPYSLLWESGLSATFTLNDAHQAATKDEKWLWTYPKSQIHHIWAFIPIQRSKMTTSQWRFQ